MVRYRRGFIGRGPRMKPRSTASKYSSFFGRTPKTMPQRAANSFRTRVKTALANRLDSNRLVNLRLGFKKRGPGSVVMNDKPTTKMEYVKPVGDGNSTSYFKKKPKPLYGLRRRMARLKPLQMRTSDFVGQVVWAYGRQGVSTFITNSNTELKTLTDDITTDPTSNFLIQSTNFHWILTNGSKVGVKLRIYEGVCKRDTATTPNLAWVNGIGDAGATAQPSDAIDAKPFGSPRFNSSYHVTQVTNVYLAQGRSHEHYSKYGYNRMYDREYFFGGATDYIRGWTRFVMFVAYGEPVADTDSDISTGSGRILICATKVQRYRYDEPLVNIYRHTRNIPVTGMTVERLMDEGSGDVETNVSV